MQLGLDLAQAGHAPLFCPAARVTSQFPLSAEGEQSQRRRWEEGHIGLILTAAPRLFCKAIAHANWPLFALTLDLAIPPLSLLVILLLGMLLITGFVVLLGLSAIPLAIIATILTGLVISLLCSWLAYGRDVMPIKSALLIASYMMAKLPLYFRALSGNITSQWIRTDRKKSR
jgi:cellulose synthase/poly-beta-1,6-N-acetylglucosamine synthase-like glycosyltransferase